MRIQRNDGGERFERVAKVDPRIDTETGEFEMVMATQGEASDGHVLRIAGISFPDSIPLQLDHGRSATDNLGTVTNMRRGTRDGVPVLLGTGQIRMSGEGDGLAMRRDLVDAISTGAISGTSMTWDAAPGDIKPRVELPKGHPARVDPTDANLRRRFGFWFEKSRAIEQSIVAIPADRAALIGRSEAAQEAQSRALWQSLLDRCESRADRRDPFIDALSRALADAEQRLRAAGGRPPSDDARPVPPLSDALARAIPDVGEIMRRTRTELDAALDGAFARLTGKQ